MREFSQSADRAIRDIAEFKALLSRDPQPSSILLGDARHALIPTEVLARHLPRELEALVGPDLAPQVMERLGRMTGRTHADAFLAERGELDEPRLFRMLCGSLSFAQVGYGDAEVLLWETLSDEEFAILWESDDSFGAEEALREGDRSRACHFQAGYAAGWCEAASGMALETAEIACRAEGASHCRFLIAPAGGFSRRLLDPRFHRPSSTYHARPLSRTASVCG